MAIKTGSYTGDGNATQAISGVGFQPIAVWIHVKADNASADWGFKTDQNGVNAHWIAPAAGFGVYESDQIISLDADGFTVGDGTGSTNVFNVDTVNYAYVAFGPSVAAVAKPKHHFYPITRHMNQRTGRRRAWQYC